MEAIIIKQTAAQILRNIFLFINLTPMNYNKILKDNEQLVLIIRRHPLVYCKSALIAIIFFLLPFFLMFWLFKWAETGLVVFIILIFLGLMALIRLLVVYIYNVFIITDKRIILFEQRGLFDRQVAEVDYNKIQDIAYRLKGFWQTIFKYGSLKIQIINSETKLIVDKIARPEAVQQLLLKVQKNNQLDQNKQL